MKARGHSGPGSERTGRSRFWRRVKWTFGSVFALVLATVALIGGSVWMENRYPSDEPGRALFPRTQRLVTRPIVEALGRQIQSHYRRQIEARYMKTGLSLRETIEPALVRMADAVVNEVRDQLTAALRELVANAVTVELARHKSP